MPIDFLCCRTPSLRFSLQPFGDVGRGSEAERGVAAAVSVGCYQTQENQKQKRKPVRQFCGFILMVTIDPISLA